MKVVDDQAGGNTGGDSDIPDGSFAAITGKRFNRRIKYPCFGGKVFRGGGAPYSFLFFILY
jgi:hypothetical protein